MKKLVSIELTAEDIRSLVKAPNWAKFSVVDVQDDSKGLKDYTPVIKLEWTENEVVKKTDE